MKRITYVLVALSAVIFSDLVCADKGMNLYFVDAHSQIDENIEVEIVVGRMEENNVVTTLLASRGKRKWKDIQELSSEYPNKVRPLLRTKSKAYKHNPKKYYKSINKRLSKGSFVGAAEILSFHAQKGDKAPKVAVKLTDERITFLVEESIRRAWPVTIHIEFAALDANDKESFMTDLCDMLNRYQKHPFTLIHMGQLPHSDVEKLIHDHNNIYFLTSHADPVTANSSDQPWVNMFTLFGAHFKEPWKALLTRYPDRFVFALDNVWAEHWRNTYASKVSIWREALSELSEESANLIAHGNAERLWQLKQ